MSKNFHMELTTKELDHIEVLSRIHLRTLEAKDYIRRLSGIIGYISKLSGVKTAGEKPTSQVTKLENVLREDIIEESLTQEEVLMNSKHAFKGYFKLPKVVIE